MNIYITFAIISIGFAILAVRISHVDPGPSDPTQRAHLAKFFSHDYYEARRRFTETCKAINCEHTRLDVGLNDEDLSIDVAWIGSKTAEHIYMMSSGIHGVEGFAGSAIQLELLANSSRIPENVAVVMIHAINPYGMSNRRRFTGANVDLNRNFLSGTETYSGAPEGYHIVAHLLEAMGPEQPSYLGYLIEVVQLMFKHGKAALQDAAVSGQNEYPKAIYYGGKELQPEAKAVKDFLLGGQVLHHNLKKIIWVDIHTGLGAYGTYEAKALLNTGNTNMARNNRLVEIFGADVTRSEEESAIQYDAKGCMVDWFWNYAEKNLSNIDVFAATVEFGTIMDLNVMYAMLCENRCFFFGGDNCEYYKQQLQEAFYPNDDAWRAAIVQGGVEFTGNVLRVLGQ